MNKLNAFLMVVLFAAPGLRAQEKAAPMSEDQKTLYTLGVALGKNIETFNLNAGEVKFVQAGLKDAALGKKPQVDFAQYQGKLQELARSRMSAASDKQKKKDAAYVDQAKKEPGAKVLDGGIIMKELKAGSGATPKATDTVKVHYKGTLTDGTEFDSSYKRGEPAEFPLGGVIPCWTQGLQKVKTGGKAKLVCPSDVAYGDQGRPPQIPGGATLVFEVELLDIVKGKTTP